MSDTEIIARILSGEDALFARIVNRYSGYVWALCSTYIRNPTDREDVAQEIFVQCYRRLDTLRNLAAFGAWLSQLARRHCLMWLRTAGRREKHLAQYEDHMDGTERTAHTIGGGRERDELHQGIRAAIDTLPDDSREALLLRYAEGYSVEDAASFLGITPAAMRKRIERAQHMLKDRLWDHVEPALAQRRHTEELAGGILAAIPFGNAPWLGGTAAAVSTSATAGSKLALIGGIAVMSKKTILVVGALLVMFGLTYVLVDRLAPPRVKSPTATASKSPDANRAPAAPANASVRSAIAQAPAPLPTPAEKKENASPTTPPKTVKPASVSGHVKDSEGQPIAGADIHLEVSRDRYGNDVVKTYRTKSGADGAYEVKDIDTFGAANVFGSAEGYVMQRGHENITPSAVLKNVDLTLPEAAFYVAGRVVDETRMPIADASVDTLNYGYHEEGSEHTASGGTISSAKLLFGVTDKDGYFKFAIPSVGLCDLRVAKAGYGPGFFPRVTIGTVDAVLVLRGEGAIAGKVTTADGKPVEGATVRVTGEALPGGFAPSTVKGQGIPGVPIVVTTGAQGEYVATGLGEAYTYTVTILDKERVANVNTAAESGRTHIAAEMRELDEAILGPQSERAQKSGVHVKAGQTTPDVDLVLGNLANATIRGTVTDRTSGKPVCPVVVTAGSAAAVAKDGKPLAWFKSGSGRSAVTNPDGSYELTIQNLNHAGQYRVSYIYMTECGSAWEQPDEEVALLKLGPGDERELNFAVDAPITVPVRYVNTSGAPLKGISAGMGPAGGRNGCGGIMLESDSEGRVTFHGIRPAVSLQAIAWKITGRVIGFLGAGDPFTGQPGETVPELTVVCSMLGGIEGTLVYPDGLAVANTSVTGEAQAEDGSSAPMQGVVTTGANGSFHSLKAVPEGSYPIARIAFVDRQSGQAYSAAVANINVTASAVTNLGTLTAQPEKDWSRVVRAADGGRKGNEAISSNYSMEGLAALSDPMQLLKVGLALYDVGRYQDALDAFSNMSAKIDRPDYSAMALVWQGQMLELLGKRKEAIAAYTGAVDMNVTSTIRHDQFGMAYAPSDYARERIQNPFVRVENRMP